jgi:hemoglobin/transferrin/lactoferrin receptor protein
VVELRPSARHVLNIPFFEGTTMETRRAILMAVLGVCLLIAASAGQGEEPPAPRPGPAAPAKTPPADAPKRPEIVVEGVSPLKPPDVFDAPYSAEVVGAEQIQNEQMSRTLPDIFKEVAGASAQKTAPGHGGSPYIRGFTGYRNVILIDGVRLNNPLFRDGPVQYWNTIDEFLVDRMDVIRGPSSVLYGSDSIGGTVYIHTREPRLEGDDVRGRTYYRYASADDSQTMRQEASGQVGNLGLCVGLTYRDFNDLVGGRHIGLMPNTGYDEYDGDAKVLYRLDAKSELVLAFQHARQDEVPRTHRTVYAQPWHGTTAGSFLREDYDEARDLVYLQYHATFDRGIIDSLKASVSYQSMGDSMIRVTNNTGATQSKTEVRTATANTPGVGVQAGKRTGAGFFTAGVDYYRNVVNSSGYDWRVDGSYQWYDRGNIADNAICDTLGVFLQDEFSIGALDVTTGIRYSRATAQADVVDPNPFDAVPFDNLDETYQAVTGSLRFLYHVDKQWNVIAGWGMGFRAPSLEDTTAIRLLFSGSSIDIPSVGLKPERSQTFDLGVRTRDDRYEFSAFAFYTLLDDYIRRVSAGTYSGIPAMTKDNFGKGWVYGYEVTGLVRVTDDWSVRADVGYAEGEADDVVGGEKKRMPLTKIGPLIGHLAVRYAPAKTGIWVEGILTSANHQKRLAPEDLTDTQRIPPGGTPGYAVFGLRGGYRASERLTVSAAVENITDRDYRIHGSGQNEPGTNFIVGVDVTY